MHCDMEQKWKNFGETSPGFNFRTLFGSKLELMNKEIEIYPFMIS